jgi:C4-dicarboxylate-specific signal transduction histidine kinase
MAALLPEVGTRGTEQLLTAVLATLPQQIAILDRNGTVLTTSAAWQKCLDVSRPHPLRGVRDGDSFPKYCARAAMAGDPNATDVLKALLEVLDGTASRRHLEISWQECETPRRLNITIETLPNPVSGAVVTVADVTEPWSAEFDIHRQQQHLIQLERAALVGWLSGAFAHELNQPLTSVLCNAQTAVCQLACSPVDLTEVGRILQDIVDDDVRAVQVIHSLRDLLHSDETQRAPLDINALIEHVLHLMRCELATRHIHVKTTLDTTLPFITAYRVQIQQVLLNLLINACEAMTQNLVDDRRLLISTQGCDGGRSIEITVIDNGCGIAAGELERVFQPLATTKPAGLGLGLVICRWIAQAHHGRIWAADGTGRGAILHLRLPVHS